MIPILILEDSQHTYKMMDNRVRYIGRRDGIELTIRQLKSQDALDAALEGVEFKGKPVMLCCDIVESSTDGVRELRKYLDDLWQEPATTWKGKRPLIIFSRDDLLSDQLGKTAKKHHRAHSTVIRQVPSAGINPLDTLNAALLDALHACNRE